MGGRVTCTTRSSAIRKGHAAGRLAGLVARSTGERMTRDHARRLVAELGVPNRWSALFTKHFLKSALLVAHRGVT